MSQRPVIPHSGTGPSTRESSANTDISSWTRSLTTLINSVTAGGAAGNFWPLANSATER